MLLMYYIFLILPSLSMPATLVNGISFVDFFSEIDNGNWIKEDNNLFCLDHQCFYAKKHNLVHDVIADDESSTYLQITLQNNCRGSSCCYMGACTRYTGGQITSRPLYTYGSFRFLALAEVLTSGEGYAAQTCFGLVGSDQSGMSIQILVCVSALNPWEALVHYDHFGITHLHKHIRLPFNAGRVLATYRIDWYPRALRFYIQGKLVASITHTKSHESSRTDTPMYVKSLPDSPMFITVSIIPDDMEKPDPIHSKVTVRMHLYKVRYIKWEDRHKQDLFVQQESRASSVMFVLVIAFIACFAIGWMFQGQKRVGNDYTLLNDENTILNE